MGEEAGTEIPGGGGRGREVGEEAGTQEMRSQEVGEEVGTEIPGGWGKGRD